MTPDSRLPTAPDSGDCEWENDCELSELDCGPKMATVSGRMTVMCELSELDRGPKMANSLTRTTLTAALRSTK